LWIPDVIVIILYRNFNAIKAIKTFFLRKNVTLPHLAVLHEKIRGGLGKLKFYLNVVPLVMLVNFSLILNSQEI
jgi:hypothetical protein